MSERLTDEELDDLSENSDWHDRRGLAQEVFPSVVRRLVAEIRAARARELTEEERAALVRLKACIMSDGDVATVAFDVVAILDKLLGKERG